MSIDDVWVRDTLSKYVMITVITILLIVWIKVKWPKFKQHVYKLYLLGFETECALLTSAHRAKLFQSLHKHKSSNVILRSLGRIRILEIGVKTGENIRFYPPDSHLICVDWNRKLGEYLINGNRSGEFSHVILENVIVGDGSCMKNVPSRSVDVVVSTRSLCSTASIPKTLQEIRRVLVPDGQFLFMEHIAEPEEAFTWKLQQILTKTGIWPSFFGGCRLDVNPLKDIEHCFKDVSVTNCIISGCVSCSLCLMLSRKHIIGIAKN